MVFIFAQNIAPIYYAGSSGFIQISINTRINYIKFSLILSLSFQLGMFLNYKGPIPCPKFPWSYIVFDSLGEEFNSVNFLTLMFWDYYSYNF